MVAECGVALSFAGGSRIYILDSRSSQAGDKSELSSAKNRPNTPNPPDWWCQASFILSGREKLGKVRDFRAKLNTYSISSRKISVHSLG